MQQQTATPTEALRKFNTNRSTPAAAAALAILDRDDTELTLADGIAAADHVLMAWARSIVGPGVTLDEAIAAIRDAITTTRS